jgi:hypothetical protein
MGRALIMSMTLPLFLLIGPGCGANTGPAQRAVNVTAKVLVETDRYYSLLYEQQRIAAREQSTSWEERDEKMRGWDEVAALIQASYRWLAVTEAAIDVWESTGDEGNFLAASACLLLRFETMNQSLADLGIGPLPGTRGALEVLRMFVPVQCEE